MLSMLKCDLFRLKNSKLFYCFISISGFMALLLMLIHRQDIRLGISIFGNLTTFISIDDIINLGIQYQKGLGIIVAIFISIFIGQEYLWNTWQQKWLVNKNRFHIYCSKMILSAASASILFLVFEAMALICSGQITEICNMDYLAVMVSGIFLYSALGTVICMISMLIKNSTVSTVAALCYVLFNETIATVILNIGNASEKAAEFASWCVQHSLYGLSAVILSPGYSIESVLPIAANTVLISLTVTVIGMMVYRKYEL